jgi:hypothetical protein
MMSDNKPMPLHITEEGEELIRLRTELATLKEQNALLAAQGQEVVLYMARNLHSNSYATSHSKAEAELFLMQSGLKNDGIEAEVIPLCALTAYTQQSEDARDATNGPEFTDLARAALLWVLYHHQGGSSKVGQPIRFALGMGEYEHLSAQQTAEAKKWAAISAQETKG